MDILKPNVCPTTNAETTKLVQKGAFISDPGSTSQKCVCNDYHCWEGEINNIYI